jgi:predicted dehydrogenase
MNGEPPRQGRSFRVGIVGLGSMGRHHARACRAERGVTLAAGCDVVAGQRLEWGTMFEVPQSSLYADYETMLERERLDLVIVATHAPAHCAPVLAAARRGVHVSCEKPLALSLREADEMVAACAAAGVRLAVNHIKRGSIGNTTARRLLTDGVIGTPYLIRVEGKGGRWAGSELMEMGTHLFDWLRQYAGDAEWLFAHMVQNGHAAGPADILSSLELPYRERDCGLVLGERAYCALGFPSGLHATVDFLNQRSSGDTACGLDVCGTEGILALRRTVGTDVFLRRGYDRDPLATVGWERIPVDEGADLAPPLGVPPDRPGERLACQRRMLRDLLDAIAEGREPAASGQDGRAALELVMASWQSQREHRPVSLPLARREHPLERWLAEERPAAGRAPASSAVPAAS